MVKLRNGRNKIKPMRITKMAFIVNRLGKSLETMTGVQILHSCDAGAMKLRIGDNDTHLDAR